MDMGDTARIHFIGIGGAGMSGIATVLHQRGHVVTGSDIKASRNVRRLQDEGIDVRIGQDASVIDELDPDIVVISSAVPDTDPELMRARELGITVWHRAQMLSFLSTGRRTVAIAGTHGKTTTSSMIATMVDRMGLDPTFLIGGIVGGYGTNGRDGSGDIFVAEADESDGSFTCLHPEIAVVTNVDRDHLDHYGTMDALVDAFCQFMSLVGEDGAVVAMGDDEALLGAARSTGRRIITYGLGEGNDYVCSVAATRGMETDIEVSCPGGRVARVTLLHNPGMHNALDATAAIAASQALGLDLDAAAAALSTFEGVGRRFTIRGEAGGVTVVDDYGHHPTEIANTLAAASGLGFGRVVCVFQPHRYTRTLLLMDDFPGAFADADRLYVMDIFPAGEPPLPGASGRILADRIAARGDVPTTYVPGNLSVVRTLAEELLPGDLVIMQGAGDITSLVPLLLDELAKREGDGQGAAGA